MIALLATRFAVAKAQSSHTKPSGAISLKIRDDAGGAVPGVEVRLPILDVAFAAGEDGRLVIRDVRPGLYVLQARKIGFALQNRIVRVGADTATVEVVLSRVASLDTVVVRAAPAGWMEDFERHRKLGLGQFFTAIELKESGSIRVSDFLRRARGVNVTFESPSAVLSRRCGKMTVFLDGVPITTRQGTGAISYAGRDGGTDAIIPSLEPEFDIDLVPMTAVLAVEVFNDLASIPPRYRFGGEQCGAIFLWTR